MFTWNFQFISKERLAAAFNQLKLEPAKGDILIRIHTAIHLEDEAVDLARYIAKLIPEAHIFGTSTSAVIYRGRLLTGRCVVSVTQMDGGCVKTAMLPTFKEDSRPIEPAFLCENVKNAVIGDDTRLMLTFLTGKYLDVYEFVDKCNDTFSGVQMIGGLANTSEINLKKFLDSGFVFNENGWSNRSIICAAISGKNVESYSSYATGVQAIGDDMEITDTFGTSILSIDGNNAAEGYRISVGDELRTHPELTNLFPYVYSDTSDIPIFVRYSDDTSISDIFDRNEPINEKPYSTHKALDTESVCELINANHNVLTGKKLKRAFIYDKKVIEDNNLLFRRIENFEKAETIFGYSCIARSVIYANCVKWEISAYENSNMCGCITEGEIAHVNGRNTFANCSFVVSVIGEGNAVQKYNPYVFSHTDSLAADNTELLNYLYEVESRLARSTGEAASDSLSSFVHECEKKLLYSEDNELPNAAAMDMDIHIKGYDRVCIINVSDTAAMSVVFSKELIDLTYRNFISRAVAFAKQQNYSVYRIGEWNIAIAAPSYKVALSKFTDDMKSLQKMIFESGSEYIAIVPTFCVIDNCTAENVFTTYYSARVEMTNKNIQFYACDATDGQLDEDSIKNYYHMVNVINYAIANDRIIPYFQGINDNEKHRIHHFESLMRIEDENGKIYYPRDFLDVARRHGLLYDTMSRIMIGKVFDMWHGITDKSVSINLSIRDIKNPEITDIIFEYLENASDPSLFVFEILENEDIDDYDELLAFVDKIHEYGGLISIDDFGSGYSNLQHIANINCDYLKLDGSIVRKCVEDEQSASLIALITDWKRLSNKDIRIIAEYVENQNIQDMLMDYGVDYSQGYLFSKPSPDLNVRPHNDPEV